MAKTTGFAAQTRVALAGSEKAAFVAEDKAVAVARGRGGRATVSVVVKRRAELRVDGPRMSRAQFAKAHGADPAAVKMVKAFAAEFELTAKGPEAGRRTLMLTGSEAALGKAFGVEFTRVGAYRTRSGAIMLPESLAAHVTAVLGLDNRPQATPKFRVAKPRATNTQYTPVQVAQAYGLAAGATAKGQTIAILELGGGFRKADLTAYFKTLGVPAPVVTAVSVDKGKNTPGDANGADGEVMLDIEVCGAVAAGAKIVVYFAPNTDQGFIDGIAQAVHDSVNKPSVLSISWGGPEETWTGQAQTALDEACQAAAVLGVTITVAAGDNGSTDGVTGTVSHVDFPASSPHVLACGGTKLAASGDAITSEVVWNETAANEGATGGGVSAVFALPSWQVGVGVPAAPTAGGGRGVPDVAGDADPATGYTIRVDGQTTVIGGTSAVAPLWAGLIALVNAGRKTPAGFVNPVLYAGKGVCRDIVSGNNGAFSAGPGWDACTGLGSPNVAGLLQVLGKG